MICLPLNYSTRFRIFVAPRHNWSHFDWTTRISHSLTLLSRRQYIIAGHAIVAMTAAEKCCRNRFDQAWAGRINRSSLYLCHTAWPIATTRNCLAGHPFPAVRGESGETEAKSDADSRAVIPVLRSREVDYCGRMASMQTCLLLVIYAELRRLSFRRPEFSRIRTICISESFCHRTQITSRWNVDSKAQKQWNY